MATMSTLPRGLEIELGTPGVSTYGLTTVTGLPFIDQWEEVPELRWPSSVTVYDRMRRDAQVAGGLRALLGPILSRGNWRLSRAGADPRVIALLETELGLRDHDTAQARRRRQGISWRRYAREALMTKSWAGHAVFEQVYEIGAPTNDQAAAGVQGVVAHLAKLGPRPPRTLGDPILEADGGLAGWKQNVAKPGRPWEQVVLPINRIVVHVTAMEGAEWRGQSLLRSAWKHWTIRDVLMRIGAMAVERNGMGIPVVEYDENQGGNRAYALQLARAVRAGDEAAVALPPGYTLNLVGVSGQVRDELPLLKFHGEMIGRSLTTMALDLGHDAGARSLGDTFLALLCQAQNAIADDFADEVTEHVIRDLVELNFGVDEPYPVLIHDELDPENVGVEDLANLAKAGLLIPDDELEAALRRRASLPLWPGHPEGPPSFDMLPGPDVLPAPAPAPQPLPGPELDVAARAAAAARAQLEGALARARAREAALVAHR